MHRVQDCTPQIKYNKRACNELILSFLTAEQANHTEKCHNSVDSSLLYRDMLLRL